MCALFIASFVATLWFGRSAATDAPPPARAAVAGLEQDRAWQQPAGGAARSLPPEPLGLQRENSSVDPSLRDLLADDDPALRDEAAALLEVVHLESSDD